MSVKQTVSPSQLVFSLRLEPARLLRARQRIRDYLSNYCTSGSGINDVVLAIEEAMTNAVRHSRASDNLEVNLSFDGLDLVALISDKGVGFDVESFDPTTEPDPLASGGRGLFLIAHLMDDLELRLNGGLQVRCVKRDLLSQSAVDGPRSDTGLDARTPGTPAARELRQHALLDEIQQAFLALDWDYRFVHVNEAGLDLIGKPPDEIVGRRLWDLYPELVGSPTERAVRDAMELGAGSIVEYEERRGWVEAIVYPTPTGVSIFSRDIDERKHAELERDELFRSLEESESRFRSLFESMTEGVALHELVYEDGRPVDYRVLDMNPAYAGQTGIDPETVKGKLAGAAYGTGEPPYLTEFARAARGGDPVEFETYFPPLDRHFRISAVATGPDHFATVFEDVTERKRREAELVRQKELLDLASDAILIWELDGTIEYWNHAAATLYACSAEEALGKTSHDLLATVFADGLPAVLAALERDSEWAGELEQTACDGQRVVVDSRMRLVVSEGRRLVLESNRDISGRKRTETELRRVIAAEREAKQEALGELERTNVLLQAAAALASTMDPLSVLETLADLTLRSLHQSRLVILGYDERTQTFEALLTKGRLAMPVGTRLKLEQLSSPLQDAVREHRTVIVDYDQAESPWEVRKILGEAGTRLALWIPVVWQDRLLGLVGVDEPGGHRPIAPREVELVEAICAQAAISIANAGRFEVQRVIATTLQESFRHPLPDVKHFDVGLVEAPASEPGLVGGDFWDVLELPGGSVFVLIGDVGGKGIPAAGMTETVRSLVRAFASIDPMPAFVLRKTNELLLREPDEGFTTALAAVIDPESGRVALASAGHPGPTLVGDAGCRVVDPRYGPPLGTFLSEYPTTEVELDFGEYLVLYTDGVIEARSGAELFGEQRVAQVGCRMRGAAAQDMADEVARTAVSFASGLVDDLQVLVLRRAG